MNIDNQNLAQVSQELTTLRDYVRWAYSLFNNSHLFYGHGTTNAWDEALQLVLSALHLPPDLSPQLLDSNLTMVERRELCTLIFRRINERIPVAYLTKEAWFANMPFYVDRRVIIPRSPIAELIENEFSPWLDNTEVTSILDLCTGSGCIAIASALTFPGSEVDAVDLSKAALEVADINIKKYNLTANVRLIEGDLFDGLSKKYDLIVSNPPYVSEEEYSTLPAEYQHEPSIALKADDQGLAIVHEILRKAGDHLHPEGILIVEVGNTQETLVNRFPEIPFTWLDFEKGGEGVFLLTAEQIQRHRDSFN